MSVLSRNLPDGWTTIALKQIGKLTQGGTPDTSNSQYWNGPYPFITGADITELYVKESRSTLSEVGFNSTKTEWAEVGNVLIVSRTRVGRIGIAATNLAVSQDVSVLKLKPGYNAKCVALILLSQADKLQDAAQGATIKGLTRDYLENIKLQLPEDLQEQEKLAEKIGKRINLIFKLRVNAERQLEAATKLPRSILYDFFNTASNMKDWQHINIADVIETSIEVFDKRTFKKPEITYIDITSVDNVEKCIKSPKIILTKDAPSRATYIVHQNDILVSTVRPNLNAVALIGEKHDGAICSNGFCVLRFKEGFYARYFFHYFQSPQFVNAVTELVQGAMYPAITDDDVRSFSVAMPDTFKAQSSLSAKIDLKIEKSRNMRRAAARQLEAISALPAATLREFFHFGENVNA